MIKMYIDLHVKYRLFLSDFSETCIFSKGFQKVLKISNYMKLYPLGAEFFHTNRRTMLRIAFGNFANAPKKRIFFKNQHLYNCLFSIITINVIPCLIYIMLNCNDGFVIFIYRSRVIVFGASRVIYCL